MLALLRSPHEPAAHRNRTSAPATPRKRPPATSLVPDEPTRRPAAHRPQSLHSVRKLHLLLLAESFDLAANIQRHDIPTAILGQLPNQRMPPRQTAFLIFQTGAPTGLDVPHQLASGDDDRRGL